MDPMTVLYEGEVEALDRASQLVLAEEVSGSSTISQQDAEVVQQVLDASIRIANNLLDHLARVGRMLAAGRLKNPQRETEILLAVLRGVREILARLEQGCLHFIARGLLRVDLSAVMRTREDLEREAGHFRERWSIGADWKTRSDDAFLAAAKATFKEHATLLRRLA